MATVGNTGIHRSGSISDYLNNSYDGNDCIGLPWEYRLTTIDFGLDELMDLQAGPVELYKLPTIQSDVERISNRSRSISCSWYDIVDDIDSKAEIRNGDCMWSSFGAGTCSSNSNSNSNGGGSNHNSNSSNGGSNSAASSYSESSAVPPAIVSGGASLIKREPEDEHEDAHETEDEEDNRIAPTTAATTTATLAEHINKLRSKTGTTATIPIPRPKASNGNILRYPSVKLSSSSSSNTAEQHIPPGASLLRKSNTKLQQMRYLSNLNNLSSSATLPSTLKNSNSNSNDEHLSEFRHNVDLAACVMGSNNISLTQDSGSSCKSINNNNNNNDANNIDHLSRELQNKSKEFRIDKLPYRVPAVTPENIADVLDVISQHCDAAVSAAATLSPPASCSDGDSDDGECSVVDSSCGSATSLDGNCMQHISDHSYTRCNEMETTLETPSDSDEEIDVVSLNDKKLPNNPSDRDRRFFSKVINKNLGVPSNGRSNYSLPYTPASSSPVKSEANSRYPSPSPSPFPPSYQQTTWNGVWARSESSSAGSDCATQPTGAGQANSRKRLYKQKDAPYRVYSVKGFAAKKRVKKSLNETTTTTTLANGNLLQQQPTLGASGSSSSASTSSSSLSGGSSSNSMLKRQFSLDEADTIEKRNQHNDMERQRRIGLKNLFEALKKQIPTIRDKERAPKVNILREAAKLCEQLTSEERELSLKRQQLKAKLKQQQDLLARLRSAKNLGE